MSTVKTNNVQIGQSVTATNNFTWYQPASPDGTVRLGVGNAGATSSDILIANSSGNLGLSVTPQTWTTYKALSLSGVGQSVAASGGAGEIHLTANCYYNAGWKYASTQKAAHFSVGDAYNDFRWYQAPSGNADTAITFTQAMTLDASGNLGIGTTSPSGKLDVRGNVVNGVGTGNFLLQNSASNAASPTFSFNNYSDTGMFAPTTSTLAWSTGGTERARIDSSGNLLVGTTTASALLYSYQTANQVAIIGEAANASFTDNVIYARAARNTTNGTFKAFAYYNTGASAYKFYVIDGGNLYSTSATVNVISDQRLKENVRDLDTGLKEILALRPRRFDWKENQGDGSKDTPGFIAQEVEQVMPELVVPWNVTGTEADDHKGLATGNLIPTLVKAIQELSAELNELKQKVNA